MTPEQVERKRAAVIEAREQALEAKANLVRTKAHAKAEKIRRKADNKAKRTIAKGEEQAAKLEGIAPREIERKIRLDVHGREKPAMRGWIHAGAAPLAIAAGIVLICLAHGAALKWACAVFMASSAFLFTNSALYHLGDWSPRVTDVLRRIDHVNIFLLIAGTYTPVCLVTLPHDGGVPMLIAVWAVALAGTVMALLWIDAPRWITSGVYLFMGWMSLFMLPSLLRNMPPLGLFWLVLGGVLYTVGGVLYAVKWPARNNPRFGCHEIFHLFILLGSVAHFFLMYQVVALQ